MKRNNIIQNIQSFKLPLMRVILILGIFSTLISCEMEDDIPPPSAYVAPEPVEGCVQIEGVPVLTEGIDFECLYPEFGTFGGTDAGTITVDPVDNPFKEGINTSDKVIMVTQTAGVEGWAGLFFDLASKVDFSEEQSIKVKVYSPAAGQNVLLKLEDSSDGAISKEAPAATTTVANEWEEISFTFSPSDTDKFDKMVLFFDFSGAKDATTVHYFDDIVLAAGGETSGETSGGTAPTASAPTPTLDASNVISLFSDAYTDVTVDTWRTDWSVADYTETTIAGDNVKLYSNLSYVGIETNANQVDASSMTHFHLDYWTGNASVFKVKLVDFGPDGAFEGGDDTVDEIEFTVTPNTWVNLDIPLSDFAELTNTANIAQYIFSAAPAGGANVYIDNVYFYKETAAAAPQSAAPTPTVDASNVISLFSDAYTDVTVDTWRTDWSVADYTETTVNGDNVKLYSNLSYVGIETNANQVDASSMTHFHVDYWTGNASVFKVKLVDFGPDGGFEGGDDTVDEIEFTVTPNTWVSLDIPLSDFAELTNTANIAQYIFSAAPAGGANVYIDNVYFHR